MEDEPDPSDGRLDFYIGFTLGLMSGAIVVLLFAILATWRY